MRRAIEEKGRPAGDYVRFGGRRRLWRDLGYAVGALLAGIVADLVGGGASILVIAALTGFSAPIVALRMRETLAALAPTGQTPPSSSP